MELKRNIYQKLLRWKEENTGRVLELKGARQVGKTYILKKFGKENFQKMIYINMAEWSGDIFLKCLETATDWKPGEPYLEHPLQEALKLYDQTFTDDKETVIIIDEIQESAQVYNQIRTFAREFRAYVIVVESYPGKISQSDFFLPVGDVDSMKMETLTFDEFLDVFGERELYETIDLYGKGKPEDYEKLMSYFEKIGGYPAVVVAYAENKDLDKCFGIKKGLMEIFENESKRYLTDIADVNLFQKLSNAIALLMMQEKQGIRDITAELSKIVYQEESGRMTKKIVNHAISLLQESHIIGYASKAVDCDYKQIKDNSRYYFLDMGIAYYFLSRTGAPYETVKGFLAENFVYLVLRRRIENTSEIAGIVPWFVSCEKIHGELDFYVRSLLDYKNYGINVKGTNTKVKELLEDERLDYLYMLVNGVRNGVKKEKIYAVPVCLADRLDFQIQ